MISNHKVIVVLPAFNAASTLVKTYEELPHHIVDDVVLVDDASTDNTSEVAAKLGIKHIVIHDHNQGYGANQKTCYSKALDLGADIVIMVHPDYQYTPKLVESMCSIIANKVYPVVYASRILGRGAIKGGMPIYKYFFNRCLTLFQNIVLGEKLSEYHTGYRAFSSAVLKRVPFEKNSNDFVFDNEITAQIFFEGFEIAELTCPTKYDELSSSINLWRSITYGFGVIRVSIAYKLAKWGLFKASIFRC